MTLREEQTQEMYSTIPFRIFSSSFEKIKN